ncbi:MAG TPA: hypothetical protein VKY51_03140 [Fredinandcohnia sp.]|nr:hypothetical protein [Fredinandcohnia sp.]
MEEREFVEERRRDDAWTFSKLAVLAVVTLGAAISIIYTLASRSAPY